MHARRIRLHEQPELPRIANDARKDFRSTDFWPWSASWDATELVVSRASGPNGELRFRELTK